MLARVLLVATCFALPTNTHATEHGQLGLIQVRHPYNRHTNTKNTIEVWISKPDGGGAKVRTPILRYANGSLHNPQYPAFGHDLPAIALQGYRPGPDGTWTKSAEPGPRPSIYVGGPRRIIR